MDESKVREEVGKLKSNFKLWIIGRILLFICWFIKLVGGGWFYIFGSIWKYV